MVQFQNNVLNYFDKLIFVLFEDEYFGFVESSEEYINRIIDFTYSNIDTFPSRKTPIQLQKFGRNYIFYKINFLCFKKVFMFLFRAFFSLQFY